MRFTVTREIVTPESAEEGCADESESWCESGLSLRSAVAELFQTRTNAVDGIQSIEPDSSAGVPRWVTVCNGMEFETGAYESRSIHFPRTITRSSAIRLARLLGCRIRA